ncbi:MAG: hypothetical protein ACR5LF_14560 [Symbiopectobacterium sp.]
MYDEIVSSVYDEIVSSTRNLEQCIEAGNICIEAGNIFVVSNWTGADDFIVLTGSMISLVIPLTATAP